MANSTATKLKRKSSMLYMYQCYIDYYGDELKRGRGDIETFNEGYAHGIGYCLGYSYDTVLADLNKRRVELGFEPIILLENDFEQ